MENQHLDVVNWFVAELYRTGVKHVCISPGSRSTPLTMAIARQGNIRIWTLLDERSAAFFALGIARGRSEPVALVCTSGTATANYLPAVMEAFQTRVPLILLTADRPAELRGIGSNQTVDQVKLYASHVKWQMEMPVPDGSTDLIRHARMMAWRAFSAAMTPPYGPVHINWPFREPLVPPYEDIETKLDCGIHRSWHKGISVITSETVAYVNHLLQMSKHPIVVCGPANDEHVGRAVARFAAHIGAPLFADVLSHIRTGEKNQATMIDTYDLWIGQYEELSLPAPDLIVRFGGTPTSKPLGLYLKAHHNVRQIVVDDSPLWRDASMSATDVFSCDEISFVNQVISSLHMQNRSEWQLFWRKIHFAARQSVDHSLSQGAWHEAGVVHHLQNWLREKSQEIQILCGNSMPIRDFETFFASGVSGVQLFSNRGASGIDGIVSTALGLAVGNQKPTILVIGDVSFYHDLNGLFASKQFALPLTIILVNNDGGGIFSFLPQAGYQDTFSYFQTSHGMNFEPIVHAYEGVFCRVNTWEEFDAALKTSMESGKLSVIEVPTETQGNVVWHKKIREQVVHAVGMVEWKADSSM